MNQYMTLIMVAGFALALYVGTRLWTEKLFPEKDKRQKPAQRRLDFNKTDQESEAPRELAAGARR